MKTCVAILALATAALAAPSSPTPAPGYYYPDVAPLYSFGYNVNNKEGYEPQLFTHDENCAGSWRFLISNKSEQLEFKGGKNIGI